MGNSGACCSGQGGAKCCTDRSKDAKDAIGQPVAGQALPSSEVMGIDTIPAPGFDSKANIADNSEGERKLPEDACPGGDSAAGGDGRREESKNVSYDDGSTYTGQLVDGKRHGHGVWQSRTGQYDGQWKADQQHGTGRQNWSDGRVYEGQFLNGKFSGTGRMTWHTQKGQLTYEGQYKDDLKHGKGKFVWSDGRTYDGEWKAGKRDGRGMYMNAKCEQKIGFWVDDKFDRWETQEEDNSKPAP
jgi:hypothetical protein